METLWITSVNLVLMATIVREELLFRPNVWLELLLLLLEPKLALHAQMATFQRKELSFAPQFHQDGKAEERILMKQSWHVPLVNIAIGARKIVLPVLLGSCAHHFQNLKLLGRIVALLAHIVKTDSNIHAQPVSMV